MAFTLQHQFDYKMTAAIRAVEDLRTRAEGLEFVNMTDADYTGGISATLDSIIALNSQVTVRAPQHV